MEGMLDEGLSISFIGGGNMAGAIVAGLVTSGTVHPSKITVTDIDPEKLGAIARKYGVRTTSDNLRAAETGSIVVIAVKPQVIDSVLGVLRPAFAGKTAQARDPAFRDSVFRAASPSASAAVTISASGTHDEPEKVIVSIAAGVTAERIRNLVGHAPAVVRTMPNTPAIVGAGVTAIAMDPRMTARQTGAVRGIFSAVGGIVEVDEEQMNAVTALSGSGPAWVMVFLESLIDAGVQLGLTRDVARTLAVQTVAGSIKMVEQTGDHPAKLRDMVTSPGGTTAAGLQVIEDRAFRGIILQALQKAKDRAEELARMTDKK